MSHHTALPFPRPPSQSHRRKSASPSVSGRGISARGSICRSSVRNRRDRPRRQQTCHSTALDRLAGTPRHRGCGTRALGPRHRVCLPPATTAHRPWPSRPGRPRLRARAARRRRQRRDRVPRTPSGTEPLRAAGEPERADGSSDCRPAPPTGWNGMVDAVIRDAILREVVRADLRRPVARADLGAALATRAASAARSSCRAGASGHFDALILFWSWLF